MNGEDIKKEFLQDLAGASAIEGIDAVRVRYLGRKGKLNQWRESVKLNELPPDERRRHGMEFNGLKTFVETRIQEALSGLHDAPKVDRVIDLSLPGTDHAVGCLHPVTLVRMELEEILQSMGFLVLEGMEVETEYYNFDALNVPSDHPARDMQDTYWLENGMLLRTHTSAMQVRALEKYGAPMRAVFPGKCFRHEVVDASHENTFYQLEGLMVDKDISIAHLIGVAEVLLAKVFHRKVVVRLRPGFFPFVEPGFEVDIRCVICGGGGCQTCKGNGWVELLPCGLVHPNVLRHGGVDPVAYSGFAFGLGLTRLAMMKYGIPEIRLFNSGDMKFCEQFPAAV